MFKLRENPRYICDKPSATRMHEGVAKYKAVERAVFYRGASEWNKLRAKDRNTKQFDSFKKKEKSWLQLLY